MNGMMTTPKGWHLTGKELENAFGFQVSPDFAGIPYWPEFNTRSKRPEPVTYEGLFKNIDLIAGGGLMETFAYGSRSPSSQNTDGQITVERTENSMSLATAVAISSAPVSMPIRYAWPFLPEGQKQEPVEYYHGDAGCIENTGLLALMQRGVKKGVSIISSQQHTDLDTDFCNPGAHTEEEWAEMFMKGNTTSSTLTSLFGYRFKATFEDFKNAWVFPKETLLPFMCRVQTMKKAGKPLVLVETFPVIENKWWGIEGGFDFKVLFMLLDKSTDFEQALPESMQKEMRDNSDYSDHPSYSIFEHIDPMYLKRHLSNMLSYQAEWSVKQNEALFREVLG